MATDAAAIAEIAAKLDVLLALQSAPPTRYLSVKSAAAYCGVSSDTIRRMLSSGKLRRLHPAPGSVRIDREELDNFLASTSDSNLVGGRGTSLKENAGRGRLRKPRPANGESLYENSTI